MRSTFYVGLWGFLYFCFVFGNEKQCLFCLFQLGTEILGKDQENRNCRFVSVKINILFAPNSCAVSSLFSLSCKHSQLSYRFQNSQWFSPLFRLGLFHLTYPPPHPFLWSSLSAPQDAMLVSLVDIPFPCPSGIRAKDCMVRFSTFNLLSLLSYILSEPLA